MKQNYMELKFLSVSENESLARVSIAAFLTKLDPTIEELTEIKTVVSEAVTNAIIHGYENRSDGIVTIRAWISGHTIEIEVEDEGIGIPNLEEARQPLYTTKPELERSGMGFTIMENFMDEIEIITGVNKGTKVRMVKHLSNQPIMSN
jgi:stage II sporulation protein AB (anti-sigma F factor)